MTRALLWKELRVQRPVLLAGAIAAVLGPLLVLAMFSTEGRFEYFDIARGMRTLAACAWPFLAVAAGAIPFATEAEDRTAGFLLSRPVSRARVWCVKVGAAAITLAATGLFFQLAIRVSEWSVGGPPADYRMTLGYSDWTLFVSSTVVGLGLMFFACAVLCSTLVTRPLTAAAASVAVGLAVLSLIFTLWSVLGLAPHLEPQWLGVEMIAVAAILVTVSLLVFAWPEQFGRGAALSVAGRAGAAGTLALVLLAIAIPALFTALTPGVNEMTVVPESVVYSGSSVAMTMRELDGTTQNWLLMTDGSGARPITGRNTLAPQMSTATSGFIAYYSRRGVLGLASDALDLRMIDTRGTTAWTAFRDMPGVRDVFFYSSSFYGTLAFVDGARIVVARTDGEERRDIRLAGTPLADAVLLGFGYLRSSRGSYYLTFASGDYDPATAVLGSDGAVIMYGIDNGETREIVPLRAGSVLPAVMRNPGASAHTARPTRTWGQALVPALAAEPGEDGATAVLLERIFWRNDERQPMYRIDTAWTDDAERAEFHRCAALEFAPDRRWQSEERPRRSYNEGQVLFGDCSAQTRAELGSGVIRLVGTRTGNMITWPLPAGWGGQLHRIHLAQRQRTVLLDVRGATPADNYAMTLELDGTTHIYPDGWTPLGWTTLDFFLLQREHDDTVSFAVGDARTGEIYNLFPDNELREVLEQRRLEQQREQQAAGAAALGGR
ncbi:MAG: ABC transporter permease subunit [Acidobacteriota bacterium]|jgi:ABC-type transport system involved in multi-copper enzyme maturation permease subunit